MLIDKLVRFFDEMEAEGVFKDNQGNKLDYRFRDYDTHFAISLDEEGNVKDFIDLREDKEIAKGKEVKVGQKMNYPYRRVRSGINAYIYEHRFSYIFGVTPNNKKNADYGEKANESARTKVKQFVEGVDSPIAIAVSKFFSKYNAQNIPDVVKQKMQEDKTIVGNSCTFILNGDMNTAWNMDKKLLDRFFYLESIDRDMYTRKGTDIVYGEKNQPISRLHESMGKLVVPAMADKKSLLVSFNMESDEGYKGCKFSKAELQEEKERMRREGIEPLDDDMVDEAQLTQGSAVSNISITNVMKYTFALEYLLKSPINHINTPNMSIIYWIEGRGADNDVATTLIGRLLGSTAVQKDKLSEAQVQELFKNAAIGTLTEEEYEQYEHVKDKKFIIVGFKLIDNCKIAINFMMEDTMRVFFKHAMQFAADMKYSERSKSATVKQILESTFPKSTVDKAKSSGDNSLITYKNTAAVDALYNAIMWGKEFPRAIYSDVLERCRFEVDVKTEDGKVKYSSCTPVRVGVIKTYINRKYRKENKEEITMALNEERNDVGYLCGRFFAIAESIQKSAMADMNKDFKASYFKTAMIKPAVICQNIYAKVVIWLTYLNEGNRIYKERRINSVLDRLERFPTILNIEQQGLFVLGYVQEREAILAGIRKNKESKAEEAEGVNEEVEEMATE